MIDDRFRKVMQSNLGCAVIIAGSDSDRDHIERVIDSLRKYHIPHEVRICSAHKQPHRLEGLISEYNDVGGSAAFVTIAGGTDGLSGTVSYLALNPVISCPPDSLNESSLTNPSGSSNAYVSHPENVGRYIAQLYAGVNPHYSALLKQEISEKVSSLNNSDTKFRTTHSQYSYSEEA